MVVVLDDLFGLPVTSGAVGVLEGRQLLLAIAPFKKQSLPHVRGLRNENRVV